MPILAYHMVEPRFDLAITRVPPRRFARQITWAKNLGFNFRTLHEYVQSPSTKSIALTFDDGFASVYQYAFPILREHGITATVFIIAGYVGQYDDWDVNFGRIRFPHLNWRQIEELVAAGWQIESHGMYHNDLRKIGNKACRRELELSKHLLEQRLHMPVSYISFPFGNVNSDVIELCRQTGYKGGVVMSDRYHYNLADEFVLVRQGINYLDTKTTFSHKILAKYEKIYKFMQRMVDVCSDGTVLVKHGMQVTKK
jgi:peptidoglycan/xylan/chitin deacetylase (PgdA/CDA1 family)